MEERSLSKFYSDLEIAGIEWVPAYLKQDDHTYHFVNRRKMKKVVSVSAIKSTLCPPFDVDVNELVKKEKSEYFGRDPQGVLDQWSAAAKEGKDYGHRVHSILEYMHEGKRFEKSTFETKVRTLFGPIYNRIKTQGTVYFETSIIVPVAKEEKNWVVDTKQFQGDSRVTPFKLMQIGPNYSKETIRQMRLHYFDEAVGGTLDILAVDWINKEFFIHDLKTDKKMETAKTMAYKKFMLPPFESIYACEHEVYSFQVCIYALMIEIITGFKFRHDKSSIIWWQKDIEKFKVMLINDRMKESAIAVKKVMNL